MLSLLQAALRLQALSDGALSVQTGLAAHRGRRPPLRSREAQGAAPPVVAAGLRDARAARGPRGDGPAPHLPAQAPGRGEAASGHAHQRGGALLQLFAGGGQDAQGGGHHPHWRDREETGVRIISTKKLH